MVSSRKLYTIAEVQSEFVVSRSTVYRLVSAGYLECIKIGGRPRITAESIDRYIALQILNARSLRTAR